MSDNKVILITGVGRGIGRALLEMYLARPDHTVIGSVRNQASAEQAGLGSVPTAENTKLFIVYIESTSPSDPAKALERVKSSGVDHIDVVIANAGGFPPATPLATVSRQELIGCFEINAAAPVLLFQTFRELLRRARSPQWISISTSAGSIGSIGVIGSHFLAAYGASKAALNWLTQTIHFTEDWLTVVSLQPGLVQTAQGDWVAKHVGLERAPTTTEESASAIMRVIDNATCEKTSGKFIDAVGEVEVPW
ncbi:NAD(P)-binding protein [Nemania sp. NC0429]|nr:NAD(P)-binding protein [Nemania sp. NC0429]